MSERYPAAPSFDYEEAPRPPRHETDATPLEDEAVLNFHAADPRLKSLEEVQNQKLPERSAVVIERPTEVVEIHHVGTLSVHCRREELGLAA